MYILCFRIHGFIFYLLTLLSTYMLHIMILRLLRVASMQF